MRLSRGGEDGVPLFSVETACLSSQWRRGGSYFGDGATKRPPWGRSDGPCLLRMEARRTPLVGRGTVRVS